MPWPLGTGWAISSEVVHDILARIMGWPGVVVVFMPELAAIFWSILARTGTISVSCPVNRATILGRHKIDGRRGDGRQDIGRETRRAGIVHSGRDGTDERRTASGTVSRPA